MSNLFKPVSPYTPPLSMVMIDKVSIVIKVQDTQYHGVVNSELIHSMQDTDIPFTNLKTYSPTYPISGKLFAPDIHGVLSADNPALLIQSTKANFKNPHFRLEYNPHKLFVSAYADKDDDKIDYMSTYLNDFFLGIFGMEFHQLIQHGKVTRMDVCVDINNHSPEEFILDSSRSLTSHNVFNKNGELSSTYLGSSKATQYVMYDKAQALFGLDTDIKLTRLEVRSKPNLLIPEITSAKNVFETMRIYDLHTLDTLPKNFDDGHIAAFKDSCRLRGIPNALKLQSKPHKKIIKQHFSTCKASWWGFKGTWEKEWKRAVDCGMLSYKPDYVPSLTSKELLGG